MSYTNDSEAVIEWAGVGGPQTQANGSKTLRAPHPPTTSWGLLRVL